MVEGLSPEPNTQGSAVEAATAGTEDCPQGSEEERLDDRDFIAHGSEEGVAEEMCERFQGPGGEAALVEGAVWCTGSTDGTGTQGSAGGTQDVPVGATGDLESEKKKSG